LFEYENKIYLIATDYYTKWIEVYEIRDMSTNIVITKFKNMFSRLGIPMKVRTDNGGCFNSALFREFSQSYNFEHVTSSPKYPQSNGLAERSVKIVKRMWDKNDDFHKAMMIYRSTALESGNSPAELMFGRNIRTGLPSVKQTNTELFGERNNNLQKRQKRNHDRSKRARKMSHLEDGILLG